MQLAQAGDQPRAMRSQGRHTQDTLMALAQLQSLPTSLRARYGNHIPVVPSCEVVVLRQGQPAAGHRR
jgi:hypothetical protein